MNVLLRTLWILVTATLKRRIGVLDEATLWLRVLPNDIDLNLHLNNGRFLSLMDLGRMDYFGRTDLMWRGFRRKWFPIGGEARIRFRRELRTFERFLVRTRILCWDAKWFYFEHVFEKSNGDLAAVCYLRTLLRGPEGVIPPATALQTLVGYTQESPPFPDVILRWIEERA